MNKCRSYSQWKQSSEKGGGGCDQRFNADFFQNFKEELTSMLLKLFCKTENKGMLQNDSDEGRINLLPESDNLQRKEITVWSFW